ncbi:hypothetical protein G7Y89_g12961 [Cudoniella acicularis]|uniref:precorrin-2 dehydrogenase n=1 Tax=Cudoniella acicularis TaxID=354080 RepID=A0A8H4R945_9HELO|nr:hypothetical protein G7Y89_g12961 [Cudoniella acicularis]
MILKRWEDLIDFSQDQPDPNFSPTPNASATSHSKRASELLGLILLPNGAKVSQFWVPRSTENGQIFYENTVTHEKTDPAFEIAPSHTPIIPPNLPRVILLSAEHYAQWAQNTPLHEAARKGNLEELTELLKRAAKSGNLDVIEFLLQHGAKQLRGGEFNLYPLHVSCSNGNIKAAEVLINHGADMEIRAHHPTQEAVELTCLGVAMFDNHESVMKLLVERGASLYNVRNKMTALELACHLSSVEIFELLWCSQFQNSALPSNHEHGRQLYYACSVNFPKRKTKDFAYEANNHLVIVQWLLDHGAPPLYRNSNMNTIMHIIASSNSDFLASAAMKAGCPLCSGNEGQYPTFSDRDTLPSRFFQMGAISLLTSIDSSSHIHLIIGSNTLAAARCAKSIEVGAKPILIAPETADLHYSLQKRIDSGEVNWLKKTYADEDVLHHGREEIGGVVDAVFVTSGPRDPLSAHISQLCRRNRIPVNVADAPALCTFSLLSTHTDGPLQIGVTTNGKGCKLSSRIRREIASSLPPQLGAACSRLGTIRRRIQEEDHLSHLVISGDIEEEESIDQTSTFNKLVTEVDLDAAKNRRMRWLSQICEYWPLRRLASITDADVESVLKSYTTSPSSTTLVTLTNTPPPPKKGKIILAGSGPGHPDLLTRATHKAILAADLVLADKLVPSGVLDLIPRRTPVHIARKFPGNADLAQAELLSLGLAGLKEGKTVLRLKQGDPYIYGRGGEEYEFFRQEGYEKDIVVLPGITSALSAPMFASIPATQRGVSDQVLICTGTGRKGKPSVPPEYVETRTVVFLMALHRISALVADLTTHDSPDAKVLLPPSSTNTSSNSPSQNEEIDTSRTLYPRSTPCARLRARVRVHLGYWL